MRRTRPNAQEHAQATPAASTPDAPHITHRTARTAEELYRAEKERRTRGTTPAQDLLAEARREYLALLASEAGGPKGGRPRKVGRPKKVATPKGTDFDDVTDFDAGDEGDDELHPSVEKL